MGCGPEWDTPGFPRWGLQIPAFLGTIHGTGFGLRCLLGAQSRPQDKGLLSFPDLGVFQAFWSLLLSEGFLVLEKHR